MGKTRIDSAMGAMLLAIWTTLTPPDATSQSNYPEKPIRVLIGFAAGTTMDTSARILSQGLGETLGKPVVVEGVLGAAGNIALERVAKSAPDGYTLALAGNGQLVVNPSLYKLPYDTVRDFAPIAQVYVSPGILVVHNSVPAKHLRELIALAKARPGELTFATGGNGSSPHVAGELLKSMTGAEFRYIPYKGTAAGPDLLAGRVLMTISPTAPVISAVRDGKLRALAVTSLRRSPTFPDVPTIDESGVPGYESLLWAGLVAPSATPVEIVRRLNAETLKVLAQKEIRARFIDLGIEVIGNSPEEFAAIIKSDLAKWSKVVSEAGIKGD
jgi:tripartite-type tricarboxylate transporter receptor subunit TctC